MIDKLISGGQVGVERIALEVAKELGIPTGGTAAKAYLTEEGPDLTLKTEFGLSESIVASYTPRVVQNIKDSDLTAIFGDMSFPGARNIIQFCGANRKPFVVNPTGDQLSALIEILEVAVLNVAGNRNTKLSAEELEKVQEVLLKALK